MKQTNLWDFFASIWEHKVTIVIFAGVFAAAAFISLFDSLKHIKTDVELSVNSEPIDERLLFFQKFFDYDDLTESFYLQGIEKLSDKKFLLEQITEYFATQASVDDIDGASCENDVLKIVNSVNVTSKQSGNSNNKLSIYLPSCVNAPDFLEFLIGRVNEATIKKIISESSQSLKLERLNRVTELYKLNIRKKALESKASKINDNMIQQLNYQSDFAKNLGFENLFQLGGEAAEALLQNEGQSNDVSGSPLSPLAFGMVDYLLGQSAVNSRNEVFDELVQTEFQIDMITGGIYFEERKSQALDDLSTFEKNIEIISFVPSLIERTNAQLRVFFLSLIACLGGISVGVLLISFRKIFEQQIHD